MIPYAVLRRTVDRGLHIADFNIIIKILYPYRKTINKYKVLLSKTQFTKAQQELVLATAHSLTVINELHRDQDKYARYYTVREDMLGAIYMLQNELHLQAHQYILPSDVRHFYLRLLEAKGYDPFSRKDIQKALKLSKTNVHRNLSELSNRGFLEIIARNYRGFIYRIK